MTHSLIGGSESTILRASLFWRSRKASVDNVRLASLQGYACYRDHIVATFKALRPALILKSADGLTMRTLARMGVVSFGLRVTFFAPAALLLFFA